MQRDTDVLVIGAGIGGIGIGIQLVRQYGTRNFELIEKSTEIGGTWWVNTYPGCGCDVSPGFEAASKMHSLTTFLRSPLTSSPTRLP